MRLFWGVIQKPPVFSHLNICITMLGFQAVRKERAPWLNGQNDMHHQCHQIPRVQIAKRTEKTVVNSPRNS